MGVTRKCSKKKEKTICLNKYRYSLNRIFDVIDTIKTINGKPVGVVSTKYIRKR